MGRSPSSSSSSGSSSSSSHSDRRNPGKNRKQKSSVVKKHASSSKKKDMSPERLHRAHSDRSKERRRRSGHKRDRSSSEDGSRSPSRRKKLKESRRKSGESKRNRRETSSSEEDSKRRGSKKYKASSSKSLKEQTYVFDARKEKSRKQDQSSSSSPEKESRIRSEVRRVEDDPSTSVSTKKSHSLSKSHTKNDNASSVAETSLTKRVSEPASNKSGKEILSDYLNIDTPQKSKSRKIANADSEMGRKGTAKERDFDGINQLAGEKSHKKAKEKVSGYEPRESSSSPAAKTLLNSTDKHKKKKKRKHKKMEKKSAELDKSEEELLLIKQQLERELAREEQLLLDQEHETAPDICEDALEGQNTEHGLIRLVKKEKVEKVGRGDLSLIKNEIAKELERQMELERMDQRRIKDESKEDDEDDDAVIVSDSDGDHLVVEASPRRDSPVASSEKVSLVPYKSIESKAGEPFKHKRPQKTSDTYWNKYADRLGIHIEEPREGETGASTSNEFDSGRTRKHKDKRSTTPEKQPHRTDRDKSPNETRKRYSGEEQDSKLRRDKKNRKSEKDDKESRRRDRHDSEETENRSGTHHRKEDRNRERHVSNDRPESAKKKDTEDSAEKPKPQRKQELDPILTRTGGAYIPPAKLKMMQAQITDKSSAAYQRLAWEALKKSINGLVNKVNVSNIGIIVRELFQENIVRGMGLLCRSLIQAQSFSPTFTHVYAATVAVINSKFPQIGELLANRLVLTLRRGVKRNDKSICMASCRFIAHLINQHVVHEILGLELLFMLLEKTKDNLDESESGQKARNSSLELAVEFMKECGSKLEELSGKSMRFVQDSLRNVLHEGKLDSRYKYMAEVMMKTIKEKYKEHPSVIKELDLVEPEDQFTHVIQLDAKIEGKEILNVFKQDPKYEENEEKYKEIRESLLGGASEEDSDGDSEGDSESASGSDSEEENKENKQQIMDMTETNLVGFRRKVYLTIQSSLDVDETAHKLLKGEIKPGWEKELCNMFIDCCAQQRTYMKFYGLLAQRFCMISATYREPFQEIFKEAYDTCHRFELDKLRNVAKLFAHLLFSDAISWEVLACVRLNADETTSSSRVYLRILFQELADFMGLANLNERLRDATLAPFFEGLLPREHPANTRFAINFFTTIGLGGLTDDLREFLRVQTKPTAVVAPIQRDGDEGGSSGGSGTSDSESSSSSGDSDSDSSSGSSSSGSGSDSSHKEKKKKKDARKKEPEQTGVSGEQLRRDRDGHQREDRKRHHESNEVLRLDTDRNVKRREGSNDRSIDKRRSRSRDRMNGTENRRRTASERDEEREHHRVGRELQVENRRKGHSKEREGSRERGRRRQKEEKQVRKRKSSKGSSDRDEREEREGDYSRKKDKEERDRRHKDNDRGRKEDYKRRKDSREKGYSDEEEYRKRNYSSSRRDSSGEERRRHGARDGNKGRAEDRRHRKESEESESDDDHRRDHLRSREYHGRRRSMERDDRRGGKEERRHRDRSRSRERAFVR